MPANQRTCLSLSFFQYGFFLLHTLHKQLLHFFLLPLTFTIKFVSFGFVGLLETEKLFVVLSCLLARWRHKLANTQASGLGPVTVTAHVAPGSTGLSAGPCFASAPRGAHLTPDGSLLPPLLIPPLPSLPRPITRLWELSLRPRHYFSPVLFWFLQTPCSAQLDLCAFLPSLLE